MAGNSRRLRPNGVNQMGLAPGAGSGTEGTGEMSFDQFVALLAFLATALPLGAIATVTLLYVAVAMGKAPKEATMLFERLAGRAYCWTMIGFMAVAFVLIGGWTPRLLLLALGVSFWRALLDLLPWLEKVRAGDAELESPRILKYAPWPVVMAVACRLQWLVLLIVYVRLVI